MQGPLQFNLRFNVHLAQPAPLQVHSSFKLYDLRSVFNGTKPNLWATISSYKANKAEDTIDNAVKTAVSLLLLAHELHTKKRIS